MIEIRAYKPLDEDFIYHSWLASIDYNVPGIKKTTRIVIDKCVEDGTILIASSVEDPDHILGWASYTDMLGAYGRVLLYVFTKKHLRNGGVGGDLVRSLVPAGQVPAASWSFWCQKYNLKKKWNLKYNSLLLPVIVDGLHAEASALRKSHREEASPPEEAPAQPH